MLTLAGLRKKIHAREKEKSCKSQWILLGKERKRKCGSIGCHWCGLGLANFVNRGAVSEQRGEETS